MATTATKPAACSACRNKTFHSADLKFRGWNPNFKRRWLQQLTVEKGAEVDVETAIVKKMIELIRKEKTGDFEWDSHRLQRVVTMSARPQDTAELQAFLFKEMFPEYRRPARADAALPRCVLIALSSRAGCGAAKMQFYNGAFQRASCFVVNRSCPNLLSATRRRNRVGSCLPSRGNTAAASKLNIDLT